MNNPDHLIGIADQFERRMLAQEYLGALTTEDGSSIGVVYNLLSSIYGVDDSMHAEDVTSFADLAEAKQSASPVLGDRMQLRLLRRSLQLVPLEIVATTNSIESKQIRLEATKIGDLVLGSMGGSVHGGGKNDAFVLLRVARRDAMRSDETNLANRANDLMFDLDIQTGRLHRFHNWRINRKLD